MSGASRFIGKIYASDQFISNVSQGTAPFVINSSTGVANLNSDLLDGYHSSSFVYTEQTSVEQNSDIYSFARSNATAHKRSLVYNTSGSEWSYLTSMRNDDSYGAVIKFGYTGPNMYLMGKASGAWTDWVTMLHSGNYTSYTVTKTGGVLQELGELAYQVMLIL